MLKLERTSRREGTVHVIMRDKERLITEPLALSFLIALAIHLSLIFLFHIDLFQIESGLSVFTPIEVETRLSLKEFAMADTKQTVQTIRGLPAFPSSAPIAFTPPSFLPARPTKIDKTIDDRATSFQKIEKEVYEPQFNPAARPPPPPLKIMTSGILAEYPLISNGLQDKKWPLEKRETRVIYSVLADRKTGKIFWMELKQASPNPLINKFAESLLKDMKFDIKEAQMDIKGEIELHFKMDKKDQ